MFEDEHFFVCVARENLTQLCENGLIGRMKRSQRNVLALWLSQFQQRATPPPPPGICRVFVCLFVCLFVCFFKKMLQVPHGGASIFIQINTVGP